MTHTVEIFEKAINSAEVWSPTLNEAVNKVVDSKLATLRKCIVDNAMDSYDRLLHLHQLDRAVEIEIQYKEAVYSLEEGEHVEVSAEDTETLEWVACSLMQNAVNKFAELMGFVKDPEAIDCEAVADYVVGNMFGSMGTLNARIVEYKEGMPNA